MNKELNEDFILKTIKYVPLICIFIICIVSTLYVSYNYVNSQNNEEELIVNNYFNLNDIQKEEVNEIQHNKQVEIIFIIGISISLVLFIFSILISKILKNRFLNYVECFEKQVRENEKQIIENKRQRETLLRAQEISHFGDWKLDLQTKNIFCSDEVIKILGLNKKHKENLEFELLKNIIFKEDIEKFEKSLDECINKNKEHKIIYRIKKLDNEIKWIESRGILDENKSFITGTILDITENKMLEMQKIQREKLLYQQSKMAIMSNMIENIAVQWKQTLSEISTVSANLTIQKELNILSDKDFFTNLKAVDFSAKYLSNTIEDFRVFFNPSNNVTEFTISNTFTKTLNLLNAQFIDKNIEIIQNIEENKISSIENKLILVLINILNNARSILITKENQRKLIFINSYCKNDILFIEITNNAGGISEDIIDRIFEPYFSTKHKSKETNIALYMSKEIIEKKLKGTITISNENCTYDDVYYFGSKFTIKITNL